MVYDVLIQPKSEGTYQATVLGWSELRVVGESEQTVLKRIREMLQAQLAQGKIVRLTVDGDGDGNRTRSIGHPWHPFLGMWKDDPTFDDLMDQMAAYRREMESATEP